MDKKDSRDKETFDYVAQMNYMNEVSRKSKITQIRWWNQYEWLCEEYKNVQEEMKKLCNENNLANKGADQVKDDRSVFPAPKTTNGLYGWLADKKDFKLEKYGSYIVSYPNPLNDITPLRGNIPSLGTGNPLF